MDCLIAIGSSILGKIAEYTVAPVGRQLGYLFYYRSNIDNLRNKVRELDNRTTSLMHQVEVAQRNGEEIEADVHDWLCKSKNQSDEASSFLANEGQIGMQHCLSSSMVSRYKSSKKAKKMKDVVNETQDGGKFSKVSYRPILRNVVENKGYETFETRMSIENEIMEALRSSSVSAVGVYGMPGAGKTMLAKEIAKKTKNEGLFLGVATVVVSQTPHVKKIQKEIAEQLGLTLAEETQKTRADRLRDRLRKEHKVLIVLDDIWDELDLWDAGIHFEDDQRGCKLLFTSRSLDVLRNLMGVDSNFTIGALSPSEAMNLFKKMVGGRAEQDDFKALAVDVVKECGGLPIAIVTVANALKNQGLSVWRDALRQLRNCSPTNIEGMSEKVYSSVKLSYDSLGSKEAKSLLLLCSVHAEDEIITSENLMRYGVGWDLFRDVDKLDEARDRVNSLLDKLKARCLLLDASYGDTVRVMMHDVIRDVGISIASEERLMINFKTAFKLEEWSSKRKLKDSTAIFLRDRNVDNHIGKLECPELELFLSPESTFLVPDHFFEETKKLRALDLSCWNLELAPSSFFVLQNLVTLRLSGCELGDVTFIGELKNLEILDLSDSNVAKLPRQIGKLTRLRLLDLRACLHLKVIEVGVISNLIRLEELHMECGFTQWEVEGVSNTSLSEIKNLSRLTILSLEIPDATVLPKDLFPEKLENFKISIGFDKYHFCNSSRYIRPTSIQGPNSFCLKLMKSHQLADLEILMQKSEEFHLVLFNDLNIISVNELQRKGFPRLKNFWLEEVHSGGMKYIVNSEGHNRPCGVFPNLERLQLRNLKMLENICYGKLAEESFGKLSVLDVEACGRLKNVVQFSIAKRLEDITVSSCGMIKEIVFQSEDENEAQLIPEVEFPRLRRLKLEILPELVQFFRSHLETGTSISSMLDCPLFSEKVVFPSLIALNLARLNIKKLWPDPLPATSSSMKNLKELKVDECDSLEYLLSSTMAKGFSQLEYLRVENCRAMEEIIATKELIEEGTSVECPSLSTLTIRNCPKLSTFLDTNSTKKDEQEGMSSVATQSLFQEKVVFPSLIDLNLAQLNIKKLWPDQLPATSSSMKNLKVLKVDECDSLEYLLSSTMAKGFSQLEYLRVENCRAMEEIIATKELIEEGTSVECPSLSTLTIRNCPKLSTFLDTNSTKKDEQEGMSSVATQSLFQEKVVFPSLIYLNLAQLNIKELWPDQLPATSSSMKNLKELKVDECDSLEYLLSSTMAKGFSQLQRLYVKNCSAIEEIIATKELIEEGTSVECPNLSTLTIRNCPNLNTFLDTNSTKKDEQEGMSSVATQPLFQEKRCGTLLPSSISFNNLKTLGVSHCAKVINLLASSTARGLVHLSTISIIKCKQLTEIITTSEEDETKCEIVFRKLKTLVLDDLPSLRRFYSGNTSITFPELEKLMLCRCPELRSFSCGTINSSKLTSIITQIDYEKMEENYYFGYFEEHERAQPKELVWEGDINTTVLKLDPITSIRHLFMETKATTTTCPPTSPTGSC